MLTVVTPFKLQPNFEHFARAFYIKNLGLFSQKVLKYVLTKSKISIL